MFREHHIIMISVGSCDTAEDWSNDAVNSVIML